MGFWCGNSGAWRSCRCDLGIEPACYGDHYGCDCSGGNGGSADRDGVCHRHACGGAIPYHCGKSGNADGGTAGAGRHDASYSDGDPQHDRYGEGDHDACHSTFDAGSGVLYAFWLEYKSGSCRCNWYAGHPCGAWYRRQFSSDRSWSTVGCCINDRPCQGI